MSQFLITSQESKNELAGSVDLKQIHKSSNYCVFVEGSYISRINNAGGVDVLLGSALYAGCRVDDANFDGLDFSLPALKYLSGRYLFISIQEHELKIINSIFGSFPCYMSEDLTVVSSSQRIISKVKGTKLSMTGLRERAMYYANYSARIYEKVIEVEAGSITTLKEEGVSVECYLGNVIEPYDNLTENTAVKLIASKMKKNASAYFKGGRLAGVSYTGGRDSRLLLCQLIKVLPVAQISCFTVGYSNDLEYFVGSKFTEKYNVNHDLVVPELLNEEKINVYANKYENINFPCLYKDQVREYLVDKNMDVLNTAIPETILCHLEYFEGGDHPAVNFVRNRKSIFDGDGSKVSNDIISTVESSAVKKWDQLRGILPSDVSANIFFELTEYQRDWVFNILRPFDIAANTVCLMEDPEVMSILSSLNKECFLNDKLYRKLVEKEYPELQETPTTRDINFGIFSKVKFINVLKNIPLLIRAAIFAGSLSKLMGRNKDFITGYCLDNKDKLISVFGEKEASRLLSNLQGNVYLDNRLSKMLNKVYKQRDTLSDYELITPLCIVAILNNNDYE